MSFSRTVCSRFPARLRARLSFLAASLLLLVGCSGEAGLRGVDSVLLISIDTLRPDYLGVYDPERETSPNLDRFAVEEATAFLDVIAQGPATAVSHRSIFYSLYPSIHKGGVNAVPAQTVTAPVEALRQSGLATGAFVGGGQLHPIYGFTKGFDTYEVKVKGQEKPLESLRDASLGWLSERAEDPFFLFVHTYQVHSPYDPPEPYRSKYTDWYEGDMDATVKGWGKVYDRETMTDDDIQYVRDLYAAQIEYVDDFLGELFAGMRELGVWDSTMIVFVSDHAEALGEDGVWGHNRLDELQLRVPLIVRVPGVEGGGRVEAPLETIDIMPTVFAALGVEPPYPFQGHDLLPGLRGEQPWPAARVRIAERGDRTSIRDSEWKVFLHRTGDKKERIYSIDGVEEEEVKSSKAPEERIAELKREYGRLTRSAREIADGFTVTGKDPKKDKEARAQLRALGYID